jgi:2'-5' RNA ligase
LRLFFSIEFSEPVKDALCEAIERIRTCCEQGSFTARENLHLTLVFLGEVSSASLPAVKEAMEEVNVAGFPLQIGGIGCFHQRSGSLYWAGVEASAPLCALYESLCEALRKRGFAIEKRDYRPHISLVRRAVLKPDCDRSVLAVPVLRTQAESFSLMLSEIRDGRRVYTTLVNKPLRGQPQ